MVTQPTIYVFKLSKETEFPGGISELIKWIEQKRNTDGRYHFRNHTPKNVKADSIVLFEIEARIIGQGIVKEGLKPTPKEEVHQGNYDYPYYVTFEPSTLEIFEEYPSEADVTHAIGKKFGRLFKELDIADYYVILSLAKKRFNKGYFENQLKEVTRKLTKVELKELIAMRDKINSDYRGVILTKTKRHYRDPILASHLKDLYDDSCQIKGCDSTNNVQHGYFTDTHHIVPRRKGKDGLDVSSNILVLCPNHHRHFHRCSVELVGRRKGEILLKVAGKEVIAKTSFT